MASGGLILESDKTTIQPSQLSRHEVQKHGRLSLVSSSCSFLAPRRGCCRRIARIYLAWVISSAVFRDVRSCLLCDDARGCSCGWWWSCVVARLSKKKKRQTTQRSITMQTFFHGNPGKTRRKSRKSGTAPIPGEFFVRIQRYDWLIGSKFNK